MRGLEAGGVNPFSQRLHALSPCNIEIELPISKRRCVRVRVRRACVVRASCKRACSEKTFARLLE